MSDAPKNVEELISRIKETSRRMSNATDYVYAKIGDIVAELVNPLLKGDDPQAMLDTLRGIHGALCQHAGVTESLILEIVSEKGKDLVEADRQIGFNRGYEIKKEISEGKVDSAEKEEEEVNNAVDLNADRRWFN